MARSKLYRLLFGWKACAFATLSTGCLTLYLFLATSKCEPLECATWAELGCLLPWPNPALLSQSLPLRPEFKCFSECGRYYAVSLPPIENEKGPPRLAIYETLTRKRVGLIDCHSTQLSDFCISGDGKFLALIWGCQDLQVHRWPTLELVHRHLDLSPFGAVNVQPLPDSQTVLMTTSIDSSFWDLGTGMRLAHHRGKVLLQPDGDVMALWSEFTSTLSLSRPTDQAPVLANRLTADLQQRSTDREHFYCLHNQPRTW